MSKIFEIIDFPQRKDVLLALGCYIHYPKGKNKFCQYNISYDLYNSNVFIPVQVNIYYASGRLWTDCCGDTNE